MLSKLSYFKLNQPNLVMVFRLEDGIYQTILPLTMHREEWNANLELPESWSQDFEDKVYIIQSIQEEFDELCRQMEAQSLQLTSINVSSIWTKEIEKSPSTFLCEYERYTSKLVRIENEMGNITTEMLAKFAKDKGIEWDPTNITPELINELVIYLQMEFVLMAYAIPNFLGNLRNFMNDTYPQFPVYWLKSQPSIPDIMSLNTYEYIIIRDSQVPADLQVIQDIFIMMVESGLRLRYLSGNMIPVNEDMEFVYVSLGRQIGYARIWLTGPLRGMFWKYRNGIPKIPKRIFDSKLRKLFRHLNLKRRVFYLESRGGFNHQPLCEFYNSQSGMDTHIRDEFERGAKPYEIAYSLGIINKELMDKYTTNLYHGNPKNDLHDLLEDIFSRS